MQAWVTSIRKCFMIPALDANAIAELVEDVDLSVAVDFLLTFDALLGRRIQRIGQALRDHDEEEITTALLSLQASAAMAGATRLQASATCALAQQPMGSKPSETFMRELQGQADMFRDAVANFLIPAVPATHPEPPGRPRRIDPIGQGPGKDAAIPEHVHDVESWLTNLETKHF